uniref:dolichyl-phosphate-mannose--protein mannosyltransferase n=1 Tax=Saccoglossus kowalevskii TaxID=10224 RepID=A0ABM0MD60_SACKO|nr:PREDICTED: transmembrane and TPR repeat-containing protein 4-like [Saccoglossus kowalevskii]
MGTGVPRFGPDINPASHAAPLTRMLTFPYLYALSSWLLLNPWWLCHDWGEGCIPLISSLDDPRNLATVIFLVFLLLLSYYGIFGGHIESRFVLISLLLVIIPFLPASNIFFYVGFVIAERALYISVFGYAILLVLGINKISQKWYEYNVFIKAVLVLLVVMYVIRSIRRTADWMDDPALHRSAIKVCPLNSKVLFNIGKDLESAGNPEEAIKWYNKTLRLNPNNYGAMLNYGKIMLEKGDVQTAKQLLERSREIQ